MGVDQPNLTTAYSFTLSRDTLVPSAAQAGRTFSIKNCRVSSPLLQRIGRETTRNNVITFRLVLVWLLVWSMGAHYCCPSSSWYSAGDSLSVPRASVPRLGQAPTVRSPTGTSPSQQQAHIPLLFQRHHTPPSQARPRSRLAPRKNSGAQRSSKRTTRTSGP